MPNELKDWTGIAPGKEGTDFYCSYLKFSNYFLLLNIILLNLLFAFVWFPEAWIFFFWKKNCKFYTYFGEDRIYQPNYFAIIGNSCPGHLSSQIPLCFHFFSFSLYVLLIVHTLPIVGIIFHQKEISLFQCFIFEVFHSENFHSTFIYRKN